MLHQIAFETSLFFPLHLSSGTDNWIGKCFYFCWEGQFSAVDFFRVFFQSFLNTLGKRGVFCSSSKRVLTCILRQESACKSGREVYEFPAVASLTHSCQAHNSLSLAVAFNPVPLHRRTKTHIHIHFTEVHMSLFTVWSCPQSSSLSPSCHR